MMKNKPILCTEEPIEEDQVFVPYYHPENDVPPVSESSSEQSISQDDSKKQFEIPQVLKDHHEAQKQIQLQQMNNNTQPKKGFAKLVQLFHIRQFIHQVLQKRRLISKITQYHLQVINDKASSFDVQGFKKYGISFKPFLQSLQENTESHSPKPKKVFLMQRTKQFIGLQLSKITNVILKIPLMSPDSKLKVFWDSCLIICRFYLMFTIPIDLAWPSIQLLFVALEVPTVICIVLLILDFFVSLFQSYYHEGQLVTDRLEILKHQIGKSYGIEIIANIVLIVLYNFANQYDYPFDVFQNPYYIFLFLQFVQYKNIATLRQQLEDALNLSKEATSLVELTKLFLLLFFVIHVFACLWFWVGLYSEIYIGNSWLEAKSILDKSFGDQYLYSFYYSTVTMFTVGYGDITPQTNPEMIVSIIFMSVCSVQLSYSVSTVGSIIEQISGFKEEKKRKFTIINNYMQSKNISYELQFQVRQYLNYFWSMKNQEVSNEEKEIIDELSSRLKQRLVFEANSRILYDSPFFKDNFSLNFKKDLVSKIHSLAVAPENVLDYTKLDDDTSASIFFIEQGKIQVFIENEESLSELSTVSLLNQGESFGFISFITGTASVEKYKTIGFTKLLIISRNDFLEVIKDYPQDYEIFYQFQEDLTFNPASDLLPMKCFSCQSLHHRAITCPLLHFKPDKEKIIKAAQFSKDQDRRNKFNRRQKSYIKATLGQTILSDVAKQVSNDNQQLTYLYEEFEEEKQDKSELASAQLTSTQQVNLLKLQEDAFDEYSNTSSQKYGIKLELPKSTPQKRQILRKKQTLQDIGEIMQFGKKSKETKEKFKQIVKKVNLMNDFVVKQSENLLEEEEKRLQEILKTIQFRRSKIHNIRHIYPQNTLIELEFYEMRMRMLLNKNFDVFLDVSKSYKFFKPKDNLNQTLNRTKISLLSNTNELQVYMKQMTSRLMKYLFYPQLYIQKYIQKQKQLEYLSETRKKQMLKRNNRISLAFIMQQHSSIKKS